MQEKVLDELKRQSGLDLSLPHTKVKISFTCGQEEPKLALLANMAALNGVAISGLELKCEGGQQRISAVLCGNAGQENMRRLLCQLGKEMTGFALTGLC